MTRFVWNEVVREQLNPLFVRQVIHGEKMTVARIHLSAGAVVPSHSHENEQFTLLQRGRVRFDFSGEIVELSAGEALHIPSHAPHSVEALEDSEAIDLFSPPREDWIRGDDAYLRK